MKVLKKVIKKMKNAFTRKSVRIPKSYIAHMYNTLAYIKNTGQLDTETTKYLDGIGNMLISVALKNVKKDIRNFKKSEKNDERKIYNESGSGTNK